LAHESQLKYRHYSYHRNAIASPKEDEEPLIVKTIHLVIVLYGPIHHRFKTSRWFANQHHDMGAGIPEPS